MMITSTTNVIVVIKDAQSVWIQENIVLNVQKAM